jgi:hypothetical protein
MAFSASSIQVAPRFHRKWKPRSCDWHERTAAGDMTASLAHSPIWVTNCRIRRWATFCAATGSPPSEAKPNHLVQGLYRCAYMDVMAGADFFTVEVLA